MSYISYPSSLLGAIALYREKITNNGFDVPTQAFYIAKYDDIIIDTKPPIQLLDYDDKPLFRDGRYHYDTVEDLLWHYNNRWDKRDELGYRWMQHTSRASSNNFILQYYRYNNRVDKINNLFNIVP